MLNAILLSLRWAAIYFLVMIGLLRVSGADGWQQFVPDVLLLTFISSFGYLVGSLNAIKSPDSNLVLDALAWAAIYFLVDCSLRLLLAGSQTFFEPAYVAGIESATSAWGFIMGFVLTED